MALPRQARRLQGEQSSSVASPRPAWNRETRATLVLLGAPPLPLCSAPNIGSNGTLSPGGICKMGQQ